MSTSPYDPLALPTLICATVATTAVACAWLLRRRGKPPREEE